MRKLLTVFMVLAMVSSVFAADKENPPADYQGPIAERPKLMKNDRWEYKKKVGRTVSHTFLKEENGQLFFEEIEDGSKLIEIRTPDLNIVKRMSVSGEVKEEVTPYRGSLKFSLWVGKKWSYTFNTTRHEERGKPGELADFDADVKVVGYEQVMVPAGTFGAFKIEESRYKRGKKRGFGKHRVIWYSPEIKRVVKTEEEDEDHNVELLKYTPGN
jgi:hypothetical protein